MADLRVTNSVTQSTLNTVYVKAGGVWKGAVA